MRTETEVLDGFSRVSWTSDNDGVLTLWSSHGQLVQGDGFTSILDDSGTGRGGESQSGDGGLGEVQQSDVVGNGTNNNQGLVGSSLLAQHTADSVKRHWRSVDLGKEQRLQDDLVEWSISTTWVSILLNDAQRLHSQKVAAAASGYCPALWSTKSGKTVVFYVIYA